MKLNDMMAPPPVHLPAFDDAEAARAAGKPADQVIRDCPRDSRAWADLAEAALERGDDVTAYAFARTGYHRSLDRLRANGWKGWGPVPYSHEPNRAVLRSIAALARAAQLIGEDAEYDRCRQMLSDADPESVARLLDGAN